MIDIIPDSDPDFEHYKKFLVWPPEPAIHTTKDGKGKISILIDKDRKNRKNNGQKC